VRYEAVNAYRAAQKQIEALIVGLKAGIKDPVCATTGRPRLTRMWFLTRRLLTDFWIQELQAYRLR